MHKNQTGPHRMEVTVQGCQLPPPWTCRRPGSGRLERLLSVTVDMNTECSLGHRCPGHVILFNLTAVFAYKCPCVLLGNIFLTCKIQSNLIQLFLCPCGIAIFMHTSLISPAVSQSMVDCLQISPIVGISEMSWDFQLTLRSSINYWLAESWEEIFQLL